MAVSDSLDAGSAQRKTSPRLSLRTQLRKTALGTAFRQSRALKNEIVRAIAAHRAARRTRLLAEFRALADKDPLAAIRSLRSAGAEEDARIRAEGLLVARSQGWAAAAPIFARLPADAPPLRGETHATALLRTDAPAPALALALPARSRPPDPPPEIAARVVVYTALYRPRKWLPPLTTGLPGARFVCLTDSDVEAHGWTVVQRAPDFDDPGRAEAFCRIRPHLALSEVAPDAEWSLYVAPEMLALGNLQTLLGRWLLGQDVAFWRHPKAADWRDLAELLLAEGGADAEKVLAQARIGEAAGLPRDRGAFDSRVIWRRHGAREVAASMDAWWRAFERAPGAPDLALSLALDDPATIEPTVLPAGHGPADDSICFAAAPAPLRAPRVRPSGRRLPVAVVYEDRYSGYASTILRGEQLSALVGKHHAERYDMRYVSDTTDLRDHVVVLTKGALWVRRPDEIAALKARNVAVIASWDDGIPDPDKVRAADAQMAVGIRQMVEMNRLFPDHPTYFVTHHVNPQLPTVVPPTDRLRTAYFGTRLNTHCPEALSHLVEIVGIDTTRRGQNWMDALHRHNCHWIIRRLQEFDGWKPMLKAFVAARCGAVAIVARDDGDAAYYFGDDYPFYVRGVSAAELEEDMAGFVSAFGGPEWRMAQAIMAQIAARSTDAHVAAEFKAMIDAVTA